jgi:hypothetical protein
MNSRNNFRIGLVATVVCLAAVFLSLHAQELRNLDHVIKKDGSVFVVTNNQSTLLESDLVLANGLKVMTNGVIKSAGDKKTILKEGRRLSLDGYWMNDDGMFVQFDPHYVIKDRGLYFVQDGVFTRLDHDVTFKNGTLLKTDGTVFTADQRMVRLQDGQALTVDGSALAAQDFVSVINGRLILQKDGSIIDLPVGRTIGMSDGTQINASGIVTRRSGQQIMLKNGQRLILEGAAMPRF